MLGARLVGRLMGLTGAVAHANSGSTSAKGSYSGEVLSGCACGCGKATDAGGSREMSGGSIPERRETISHSDPVDNAEPAVASSG